jgi:hypothetical protein
VSTTNTYSDTLAHCQIITSKINRLSATLDESMAVALRLADREFRDGQITIDDIAELYGEFRDLKPGFSTIWNQHMSVHSKVASLHLRAGKTPTYWSGPYPYDGSSRPMKGTPVVYVLYNAANEPVYLGSTGEFGARMRRHRADGKPVAWWLAFPCESREAAYLLEGGLLAARKPPLNIKVGR